MTMLSLSLEEHYTVIRSVSRFITIIISFSLIEGISFRFCLTLVSILLLVFELRGSYLNEKYPVIFGYMENIFIILIIYTMTTVISATGGLNSPLFLCLASFPVIMNSYLNDFKAFLVSLGIILWYYYCEYYLGWNYKREVISFEVEIFRFGTYMGTLLICWLKARSDKIKMDKLLQKSRANIEFLSTMSHEMRTPLMSIIGSTDMLFISNDLTDKENIQKSLNTIKDCGSQLLMLINDTLDYSKMEVGIIELEEKCFNLNHHLNRIYTNFEILIKQKNLQFDLNAKISPNTMVKGDIYRIKQCLNNLLSNSTKFTSKGSILLLCEETKRDSENIWISFSVQDTGIGMDNDTLSKISQFKPYTQANASINRKYGGTGLGLCITQKIIKKMGSNLIITSELDKGSNFTFEIKFRYEMGENPPINTETPSVEESNLPVHGLCVLVAEDNLFNQSILKTMIKSLGLECDVAENGLEAVNLCLKKKYDLILLDLNMPLMKGSIAAGIIKQKGLNTNTSIILLSGSDMSEITDEEYKLFDNYLRKPVSFAVLKERLQDFTRIINVDHSK